MKKTAILVALGAMFLMTACSKDETISMPSSVEWIDLGLPSGMLWASCNIGASRPEDNGNYYAWGETTAKDGYHWTTYTHCKGGHLLLTKYCTLSEFGSEGFTDGIVSLQSKDDPAAANWGNGARTPTREEWQELLDSCSVEWTTLNGRYGSRFTGPNGRSVFFPAAGRKVASLCHSVDTSGYYWTASLGVDAPYAAWYLNFDSGRQSLSMNDGYRFKGLSVRAVRSAR